MNTRFIQGNVEFIPLAVEGHKYDYDKDICECGFVEDRTKRPHGAHVLEMLALRNDTIIKHIDGDRVA